MTDNENVVKQHQLDRLAAGDTSIEETRQIVASLDDVPDGWKQCALALLEAQSWRRTIRSLTAKSDQHVVAVPQRGSAKRSEHRRLWRFVGTATLVAVALIGGISLGRHSIDQSRVTVQPSAESQNVNSDNAMADHRPETRAAQNVGDAPQQSQKLVGLLKVESESGASRLVPVVFNAKANQEALNHEPPLLSEYERHLLALSGWQVTEDRKLLTVQLADGGKLTIPIGAIQYRAIHRQVY